MPIDIIAIVVPRVAERDFNFYLSDCSYRLETYIIVVRICDLSHHMVTSLQSWWSVVFKKLS